MTEEIFSSSFNDKIKTFVAFEWLWRYTHKLQGNEQSFLGELKSYFK